MTTVYRLSRLYDRLSERSALVMLAAWRGSTLAVTRAKYRPTLYDDERHRARPAPAQTRPAVQPGVVSRHAKHLARLGKLALRQIEKMPPCAVLDLHDPGDPGRI